MNLVSTSGWFKQTSADGRVEEISVRTTVTVTSQYSPSTGWYFARVDLTIPAALAVYNTTYQNISCVAESGGIYHCIPVGFTESNQVISLYVSNILAFTNASVTLNIRLKVFH